MYKKLQNISVLQYVYYDYMTTVSVLKPWPKRKGVFDFLPKLVVIDFHSKELYPQHMYPDFVHSTKSQGHKQLIHNKVYIGQMVCLTLVQVGIWSSPRRVWWFFLSSRHLVDNIIFSGRRGFTQIIHEKTDKYNV